MKHVTDLKKGFLYRVKGNTIDEIMLCTEVKINKEFSGRSVYWFGRKTSPTWNTNISILSEVVETHPEYNDNFVFYEMGPKEQYPEYLL